MLLLQFRKCQTSNITSTNLNNIENLGESSMADASPMTDISTDDTDEKNQSVGESLSLLFKIWSTYVLNAIYEYLPLC